MKEIIAIIRRHQVPKTKDDLRNAGFMALTIQSVEGRGLQRGIGGWVYEIDPGLNLHETHQLYADPNMKFIPKRMLTLLVEDQDVRTAVDTIIKANQTGQYGDGKIFVCPMEEVYTVRTGEQKL